MRGLGRLRQDRREKGKKGWREPEMNGETGRKRTTAFYNQGQSPYRGGVCMIDSALLFISRGEKWDGTSVCVAVCVCS